MGIVGKTVCPLLPDRERSVLQVEEDQKSAEIRNRGQTTILFFTFSWATSFAGGDTTTEYFAYLLGKFIRTQDKIPICCFTNFINSLRFQFIAKQLSVRELSFCVILAKI